MRSADSAAAFVKRLTDLAERLASRNIVVEELQCLWGSFGSWRVDLADGAAFDVYNEALTARRYDVPGPHVVRFWWDGRDQLLTVETSPRRALSSPNEWTRELDRAFDGPDAAVQFLEEFIATYFGGTSEVQ